MEVGLLFQKIKNMRAKKDIFKTLHASFNNGIRAAKSKDAKAWLESKSLSIDPTGAGFSSGQTHHRREQTFIDELLSVGFLVPSNAAVRSPELKAYTSFGKEAIVFALKNKQNEAVNFFAIRISMASQPSDYLNGDGIYPSYPHELTERLYITENTLDAATLLEAKILDNRDAVISLHDGTMTNEHYAAIEKLSQLQEIILIPSKNNSKETAIEETFKNIAISRIELPEDHSLNDMWINYQLHGLTELMKGKISVSEVKGAVLKPLISTSEVEEAQAVLKQINESKLCYETTLGKFYVLGNLSTDLGTLKATFCFEEADSKRPYRNKLDLFERNQVIAFAKTISEAEQIDFNLVDAELLKLTNLLDQHREKQLEAESGYKNKTVNLLPPEKEKEAITFLSQPNLIDNIDKLIATSGIVGEENNRKIVFVIASTYKMPNTLHCLVQGTSGSGKSHLINGIAKLMPAEDIINITRVSSKSFYYHKKDELVNKLMIIQDIDGLDEQAMFAFRELQTAGFITNTVPHKDKYGNLRTVNKTVNAHFASLVATTHAEIYFDNLNRSVLMGVDESDEQTQYIIQQQNRQRAGLVDEKAALQAKELLQNCIRCLKPYEVVNRFADKLSLPVEARTLRRLNTHYQEFVTQITLLNQYQRNKDEQGRLITTIEDLKTACEIMFDAIMWKIDELDSSLRRFFERLKVYVKKLSASGQHSFCTREVRQAFNISKSQASRYIQDLKNLEYIQAVEGSANKGYKYKIVFWDDMDKIRQKVKADLMNQIAELK